MLTVKELPRDLVLTGTFTSFDQAVGQTTKVQIVAGEQVMPTKVTSAASAITTFGETAPLSLVIPQGKRAFSIFLSPVAAAGGLSRPGDRVDILLSTAGDGSAGDACYILQDVEVLAVGETLKRTASEGDTSGIAAAGVNSAANSMTLAVTPGEARQLAAYQKTVDDADVGQQLWVSLRPFGERGATGDTPACTASS
jgi:pilus assembly protein CpaB